MPAFNEVDVIQLAVTNVEAALKQYSSGFEIIVVDDGSTDGTVAQLDRFVASGTVRVLRSDVNQGYGWALRTGFAAATRPWLFLTDSDDQFDPMDLARLLPLIDEADIVVGRRTSRADGALRSALSDAYNGMVRLLLGVAVRDVNCAFKLARREALSRLGLVSSGYCINAEMIARAYRAGLRVRQTPVSHRPRTAGRSKVRFADVPKTFADLLAVRRALDTVPTPDPP